MSEDTAIHIGCSDCDNNERILVGITLCSASPRVDGECVLLMLNFRATKPLLDTATRQVTDITVQFALQIIEAKRVTSSKSSAMKDVIAITSSFLCMLMSTTHMICTLCNAEKIEPPHVGIGAKFIKYVSDELGAPGSNVCTNLNLMRVFNPERFAKVKVRNTLFHFLHENAT